MWRTTQINWDQQFVKHILLSAHASPVDKHAIRRESTVQSNQHRCEVDAERGRDFVTFPSSAYMHLLALVDDRSLSHTDASRSFGFDQQRDRVSQVSGGERLCFVKVFLVDKNFASIYVCVCVRVCVRVTERGMITFYAL